MRAPYVLYHLWDDLDCWQSGSRNSSTNIVNLVLPLLYQQEYVNDVSGLFDGNKYHLTFFGKKKKMIDRTWIQIECQLFDFMLN